MRDDEMMHYGVLGMKWGVRKSRSTGSTKSSSKRKTTIRTKASEAKRKALKRTKKEEAHRKKIDKDRSRIHTMSDKDIQKKIQRIQNETKLKEVIDKEYHPTRAFVKDVLNTSGKTVAIAAVVGGAAVIATYLSTKSKNPFVKKWMTNVEKRLTKK